MRKGKKKWIILGVAVLAVAVLAVQIFRPKPVEELYLSTAVLGRMDLQNTVDATGNVQSANSINVYSSQSYPVRAIHVELGDVVEEGDLLCELDASALQTEIAVAQANLSSANRAALQELEQAQNELERKREDLAEGNSDAVRDAKEAVEEAERSLRQARLNTNMARDTLEDARRENRSADEDVYSRATINAYRSSLNQALISEEDAEAVLALAEEKLERAREDALKLDLSTYEDRVANAQLAGDFTADQLALSQLQKNLADCAVTAPGPGTVTAIYAVVGDTGSGLLFVIEDVDNLEISTTLKEYDIGAVMLGDPVLIRTDGARGEIFEGELIRVAPSTYKGEINRVTGEKETVTDAVFAADVRVTSADHRLLIGMSARLNIVVEERFGVLAVSYDLLGLNELGEDCVYVAEEQEDGSYVARVIPVTIGMETDFYSEISGDGLEEGMLLIADTLGLSDGDPVNVIPPMEMAA